MNAQTQAADLFKAWGTPPERAEACARDYVAVLRLLVAEAARQEQEDVTAIQPLRQGVGNLR